MLLMDYAARVRAIMEANGWTQNQAAEAFGVKQPTISRWLKGAEPEGPQRDLIGQMFDNLGRRKSDSDDQAIVVDEPLKAHEVDEPIIGQRAIRSVLGRIVGLSRGNADQLFSEVAAMITENGVELR